MSDSTLKKTWKRFLIRLPNPVIDSLTDSGDIGLLDIEINRAEAILNQHEAVKDVVAAAKWHSSFDDKGCECRLCKELARLEEK